MKKIWFIFVVLFMSETAYLVGRAVGVKHAQIDCISENAEKQSQQYINKIKIQEKANAQTNSTAVRDIRRVLHEKYTIAE